MNSTLISNSNTYRPRSTRPSRPSSNFRMPHVFVIPPEEEQQDNPPWCCFDADEHLESNGDLPSALDIHLLDDPHLFQQHEFDMPAAIPRRTSAYKPRPRDLMPKKLEKKQRPEAIKIVENKSSHSRHREDSDVVEVVKVKRCRDALTDLEENTNVKRSKTLRSRASKALCSIKNVGKPSRRTHVKDLWASGESTPGIFKGIQEQIRLRQDQAIHHSPAALTDKRSLSRGNSRSFSRIFQPVKPSRPESSFAMCALSSEPNHVPAAKASTLPHLRSNNMNPSLNEALGSLTIDDTFNRPASPKVSMRKHTSRKLSVRELHKLFTFSSSSLDTPPSVSASTLTFSSPDCPDSPMEDIFADAHFIDLERVEPGLVSPHHRASHTSQDDDKLIAPCPPNELSFEMRLGSLHFDSLSFDPENFDVSMEGSAQW